MTIYILAASVILVIAASTLIIKKIHRNKSQETVLNPIPCSIHSPVLIQEEPKTASPEFQAICDKVKNWYGFDVIKMADGKEIRLPRKRDFLFYVEQNLLNEIPYSTETGGAFATHCPSGTYSIIQHRNVDDLVDEINLPFCTEEERKLVKQIQENDDFILDTSMAMELGWI